ncbi:hypothetical protein HDU86_004393 [Geranomyces michiganensis]|nr:hypothetical protein HDU86_004393 [Geranomyces michiganensis]
MVSRTPSPPGPPRSIGSSSSYSSKSTSSSSSSSGAPSPDTVQTFSPTFANDFAASSGRRRSVRLIERVARRFHLNFHDEHDKIIERDPESGRKIHSKFDLAVPQRASHHADTDNNRNRRQSRSGSPPPPQQQQQQQLRKGRRKSSIGLISPPPPMPSGLYELPVSTSSSFMQHSPDAVDLLALIESYSRPESVVAYGTALPPPPRRRQAGPVLRRQRSLVALRPAFQRRPSYSLAAADAAAMPLDTPMSDISVDPFEHALLDDDEDAEQNLLDGGVGGNGDKGTLHLLDHATAVGFDTLLFGDNRKTIKVSLTPNFIASAAR